MSAKQTPESFWKRVNTSGNGCWEWGGTCNNTGYGTVAWNKKVYVAHRVAAWLVGLVPTPAAPRNRKGSGFVLHTCDNRKCCNPKHFEIGTYSSNQLSAYGRRRRKQPQGQYHANAKLTNAQAQKIRELYFLGVTQVSLAAEFGTNQASISQIIREKKYT